MRTWRIPGTLPGILFFLAWIASAGIRTWASVEPVIEPGEALRAIAALLKIAHFIKVGKWNHDRRANAIDWKEFHTEAARLLEGHPHLFKHDLLVAAGVTP